MKITILKSIINLKKRNEGFSIVEVVVFMLLLSILSSGLIFSTTSLFTHLTKLQQSSITVNEISQFYYDTYRIIRNYRLPFWKTMEIEEDRESLKIGPEEDHQRLIFNKIDSEAGQYIEIEYTEFKNIYGPFDESNVRIERNSHDIPTGVNINIVIREEQFNFILPFSTFKVIQED